LSIEALAVGIAAERAKELASAAVIAAATHANEPHQNG